VVDVKVDSEGESINAAEARISWPVGILELSRVSTEGSVFNFWVEEPLASTSLSSLGFIGGSAKGISGEALQILRLTFKTVGGGVAEVSVSDGAITAADGKGTNVLSRMQGASFRVGAEAVQPAVPVPEVAPVVREAIPASDLPQMPNISIPLYPDPAVWNSRLGEMTIRWDVPLDITQIAVGVDQNPNTNPSIAEQELFTGKKFGTLSEGVWYVHVRFRNNIGWGPTAHYRIAIDVTPPLPFEIGIGNVASDNPAPDIQFETRDSLSGIARAAVVIDGGEAVETAGTTFTLPLQKPGGHRVAVRIFDNAGNSVEDNLEFEILPLPTPSVDFATNAVVQGEAAFISGKSLPNSFVDVVISRESVEEVRAVAITDGLGNWSATLAENLLLGNHIITAVARDDRGAVSYPSAEQELRVRAKPVLSIGFIDLGWFELLIILALVAVSAASVFAWHYATLQKKRSAYETVAVRDLEKLNALTLGHVDAMERVIEGQGNQLSTRLYADLTTHLKRIRDTIAKMNKYVGKEIGKLK